MTVLYTQGSTDADKSRGDRGQSEGLHDRLTTVSGRRDLGSQTTLLFLSSHSWVMVVPFMETDNTKGEWGCGGCGGHKEDLGGDHH